VAPVLRRAIERLRSCLFLLIPPWARESARGDIEEEYRRRLEEGRWLHAQTYYIKETLALAARYSTEWWRGAPQAGASTPLARLAAATAQDLSHSMRSLVASWGFAAISILCLALAIGATTTGFAFVDALLLQPVPVSTADRIVSVRKAPSHNPTRFEPLSYLDFLHLEKAAARVAVVAAIQPETFRIPGSNEANGRVAGARISSNFFPMWGTRAVLGRGFSHHDMEPGAPATALISYAYWRDRFNGSAGAIGSEVTLDGMPHVIVGVLPKELAHAALQRIFYGAQVWVPLRSMGNEASRGITPVGVYARLEGITTLEGARRRFADTGRTFDRQQSGETGDWVVSVEVARLGFSPTTRAMALIAMGALGFVFLIGCTNVANLTLARATGRRREVAMRVALGARGARVCGHLLADSVVLAAVSLPPAIAVAYVGRRLLLSAAAAPEFAASVTIGPKVLVFSAALAVAASLFAGLLPALHVIRRMNTPAIAMGHFQSSGMSTPRRLSQALVVAQVALAMVLMVGAALFLKSLQSLQAADGGFDTRHILAVTLEPADWDRTSSSLRLMEVLERLRHLPGATASAVSTVVPLRGAGTATTIVREDSPEDLQRSEGIRLAGVTNEFFEVLDVPLRDGRIFTETEQGIAKVAVINETAARRMWPEGRAVGRRFKLRGDGTGEWITVVGVSADILSWDAGAQPLATAYLPYLQMPSALPTLLVRAADPAQLASALHRRRLVQSAEWPIAEIRTMNQIHAQALARQRALAWLLATLSAIALLLGATGVYGVCSYFIRQRRSEIGIRTALGADRLSIVWSFVKDGLSLAGLGVAIGLLCAYLMTGAIRSRLHDVGALDPITAVVTSALLLGVALLAVYLPARHAASVDPVLVLRQVG